MKTRCTFLLVIFSCLLNIVESSAQQVFIPDANFRAYLQTNYPSCMSGNNLITNCSGITSVSFLDISNKSISDLTGIEYFTAVVTLRCQNNLISDLSPLLNLGNLKSLNIEGNQLVTITALPMALTNLVIYNNQFNTLPTLPTNLQYLYCGYSQLTTLPALPSTLIYLDCAYSKLNSLPSLPNGLCELYAINNTISCLPNLPTCSTFSSDIGTTICQTSAVFNTPSNSNSLFYPNPFTSTIEIKLVDTFSKKTSIYVLDMNGKVCEMHTNATNEDVIQMGAGLNPGMYIVEIETNDTVERIKIVKQ